MESARSTATDREPPESRHAAGVSSSSAGPPPVARSLLALQRAAGNRAVGRILARCAGGCRCGGRCLQDELLGEHEPRRVLARASSEQQFALTHEGQVESTQVFLGGVPQDAPEDVDEFVLWNFLVNRTELRKGHEAKLDPVAARWATELAADARLRIRVIGYASVTGSTALNEDLARRRAESVRDHLVGLGVPEDQVIIDSSGSRLPMDEGTSPEGLARNRRVEISKFFTTSVATSLSDLGSGIDVRVDALDFLKSDAFRLTFNDQDVHVVIGGVPQVLRARVRVTSPDPDLEVGFLQFATADFRRGGYKDVDSDGNVPNGDPPASAIDYDHCLSDFGACRDVQFAKLPFSQVNRTGRPRAVAGPSPAPSTIRFFAQPEAFFPNQIEISEGRSAVLTQVLWKMQFTIVLVARKGQTIVPLEQADWEFRFAGLLAAGPQPKLGVPRFIEAIVDVTGGARDRAAKRPLPDIERAMSMPTCTLRTRMMNQLCKPTISESPGGLGPEFDAMISRSRIPIPPEILQDL
jgi:outer membrane protein OmpA-like peptidoglycan-associated protein